MKRALAYLAAATLALAVPPACALATTAQSPILLGETGDESCFGTLPLPNGNLILSLTSTGGRDGGPEYGGNIRKVWLLCLAPDGSTVWETEFGENRRQGYTTLLNLAPGDNNTFTGIVRYTLSQYPQYRQKLTFSCADGSIVSEGETVADRMVDEKISVTYFTAGHYTLLREVHNCETTCEPCILHMFGPDGSELWQLDADVIGLSYLEGLISAPGGAILYGKNHAGPGPTSQAAALLVNPEGGVVWYRQAAGVTDGSLFDAMIDSNGRFIAVGIARGEQTYVDNAITLGFDPFSQLLICWDAATGDAIWQRTTAMTDRKLPYSHLAAIGGQYILCDSDIQYQGSVFETLDHNGRELQYWTRSMPGYTQYSRRFFLWNGELWTQTTIEDSDMDVMLERVIIP